MPSPEYDLAYLAACTPDLEEYVLSPVLFWPVNSRPPAGSPGFPRLTLGGLLLARRRLSAQKDGGFRDSALVNADGEIGRVREKWESNWARKAATELPARLKQWENYLKEYMEDPGSRAAEFPTNVQLRVILDLLFPEAGEGALPYEEVLSGLDRTLRTRLVEGDFCWVKELESGFPKTKFWYLYGSLLD
ncbi:MAG TPA: hypothetical protein VJ768_02310 [Anaerolineales bacterium]|nr:hypothetical protein [Anaerolineales bacterium]